MLERSLAVQLVLPRILPEKLDTCKQDFCWFLCWHATYNACHCSTNHVCWHKRESLSNEILPQAKFWICRLFYLALTVWKVFASPLPKILTNPTCVTPSYHWAGVFYHLSQTKIQFHKRMLLSIDASVLSWWERSNQQLIVHFIYWGSVLGV